MFTPGKSTIALPLKLTPPIVLAVAKTVAVAAFPVYAVADNTSVPLTFNTFPVAKSI